MKFVLQLYALGFFVSVQASYAQASSQKNICYAFGGAERSAYIRQTSEISALRSALQTATGTLLAPLGYGLPTALRGIKLPKTSWEGDGRLFLGRAEVSANFEGPWGRMSIRTQSGAAEVIEIGLEGSLDTREFGDAQKETLRRLFPDLNIRKSTANINKTYLDLSKNENEDASDYEMRVRSLVNTLVNDPIGILGSKVAVANLPKDFSKFWALDENRELLMTFGEWSPGQDGESHAQRDGTEGARLGSGISINTKYRILAYSLETTAMHQDTLANIRRIIRAAAESNLIEAFGLPETTIDGIAAVSVDGLPILRTTMEFVKLLESYRNDPAFESPLTHLSDEAREEVQFWLRIGGLNQNDLLPNRIHYTDLVAVDESKD